MNDHRSVTIVMIEDDEGHARLIEKNIRRAGIMNDIKPFYQTARPRLPISTRINAPDGRRSRAARHSILLDLNLPDMSGTDILARIKSATGPLQTHPRRRSHHHRRQDRDTALLRSWLQRLHHQAGQL